MGVRVSMTSCMKHLLKVGIVVKSNDMPFLEDELVTFPFYFRFQGDIWLAAGLNGLHLMILSTPILLHLVSQAKHHMLTLFFFLPHTITTSESGSGR